MEPYSVHAIRYGSHERTAAQNFIGGDAHEAASNLDYYVWLVSNKDRTLVVDTGFTREEAARRQRNLFQEPAEGLARMGVEAARVEDVVITHMHYDHAGSLGAFPNARLHIQDDEMAYCTGRYMAHECFGMPYSTEHVIEMVRAVFAKRVAFHRGDEEIAPGVSLHRIGGHTMGIQSVRVWTQSGWLVLRLGRRPPLREHGGRAALPDRVQRAGNGGRVREAPGARRDLRARHPRARPPGDEPLSVPDPGARGDCGPP